MDDVQPRSSRELALLRRLAGMVPFGAWEFEVDTARLFWTDAMYALHEVDAATFVPTPQTIAGFHPPAARARIDAAFARALATGEGWDFELPLTTARGGSRWVRTRSEAELRGGRCVRLVGTLQDVTAERRLRDIDEWLRLTSAATGVGFFQTGLDQTTQYCDPQARRLYGIGRDEPMPTYERFLATAHPDDRERIVEARQRALASDRPIEAEYRVVHRDGSVRLLFTRRVLMRDDAGQPASVVGTVIDVTEQRHAEMTLRAAERRSRAAMERAQLASAAAGIGVWERNLVTGEGRWDEQTFRLFGLEPSPEPPLLSELLECIHPDDRQRYAECRDGYREATGTVEIEFRVIRPGGSEAILLSRGQAAGADDERQIRAIGTLMDMTERRRAERELRDALERVRLVSAAVGIGTWERDLRTNAVHWDLPMYALFGTPPAQGPLSHDQIDAMMEPEAAARARAAWDHSLRTGEAIDIELPIRRPDGERRVLLSRGTILRDRDGRPARISGIVVDLTAQRRAEYDLRRAKEQLELAAEASSLGIWTWDVCNDTLHVDARICELLAAPDDWQPTFEGRMQFVHAEDAADVRRAYDIALESGQTHGEVEYRIVRSYGEIRVVYERFIVDYDAAGRPRHVLGTILDITAIRRAQIERDELAERLRLATSATGMAVWHVDAAGTMLADELLARLHGIEPQPPEQLWPAIESAIHRDDLPALRRASEEARESLAPFAFEYRVVDRGDNVRHLAVRGHYVADEKGRAARMLGVTWDVTERHAAEAALRARETAERASRAKTEFLSRMSHELRTPLNAILGFAQVLELDPGQPLTPTQRERVGQIAKAGWHLLNLINEILDLSRIEAGATRLAMANVDVEELLGECQTLIEGDARRLRLRLRRERQHAAPGGVWADRTRLKQVLLNLLSNAVKYNREGGEITMVHGGDALGNVAIAVRDTGAGLSPAQIGQLFQPFNRLGLESAAIEGTGIGLTISQKLVEQMGGTLQAASEPGTGSEFRISLPAATAAPQTQGEARADGDIGHGVQRTDVRGTLLYVEDNASNVAVVQQLLTLRPNVTLYKASDGASARVLAAVCQPDLILLDMRLPDTDGIALYRDLQAQPETAGLACVGLSANALPVDVAQARGAGFVDYWTKPLEAVPFLRGLDRLLGADTR